ncbi:hypothetical protein RIF29_33053 [Crotalaria pallida]|uniref:RING-type E3 ubiquitin transferase n=1 Tax=Crotalaria pallida TaxID=3830 RepID=A0AAN9E8I1_CROPI
MDESVIAFCSSKPNSPKLSMIRNQNESNHRLLAFPTIRPCVDVSLTTLLSSLIALSRRISTFTSKSKSFPCNKRNAIKCIRFVEPLGLFLQEIRDCCTKTCNSSSSCSLRLALSELHVTFQKLLFLLEDSDRQGARLWMLMESDRVVAIFRDLTQSIVTAFDVFESDGVEVSEETMEQVELVKKQARKARFEVEGDDERVMMCVVSVLEQFEKRVAPNEGDLKWVLDYIGVKGWSECTKEVEFLEGEFGLEWLNEERGKVGFLSSLIGFMSYCRCVVCEFVDAEKGDKRSSGSSCISGEILSCFKLDDFRCPISLELMTDPVTIETGHTYDRVSILKWFRSGKLICPKTGKRLSSIEWVPNSAIRRLIHQYCFENGIPVAADPGHRNRDIAMTVQPGSLAAEEAMKMLASFLTGKLENGAMGEKNRAAYEIRLLSKTSIFNRSCLVEAGSIPLLLKLVSWWDSSTQENAVAALQNLAKFPKGRAVMVENWGIQLIVGVLNGGLKIEARQHAAATLFYLASNEEYGEMIGEEPEAIPSLIKLIKDGSDRGKKIGLVAISSLLSQPENHRRVLTARVVPLLVDILKTCEKEDLVTGSLVILAALAEKSDGTIVILNCGALDVAVKILSSSTSRVGKEHIVSLLLSLSINGGVDVVARLVKSPSLMGSLYSQLSEGTSQVSKKASALIRILHDFYERRSSSGHKTSVLPQEQQFIHVW